MFPSCVSVLVWWCAILQQLLKCVYIFLGPSVCRRGSMALACVCVVLRCNAAWAAVVSEKACAHSTLRPCRMVYDMGELTSGRELADDRIAEKMEERKLVNVNWRLQQERKIGIVPREAQVICLSSYWIWSTQAFPPGPWLVPVCMRCWARKRVLYTYCVTTHVQRIERSMLPLAQSTVSVRVCKLRIRWSWLVSCWDVLTTRNEQRKDINVFLCNMTNLLIMHVICRQEMTRPFCL